MPPIVAVAVALLLGVGLLGLMMRRFGWPRPPFVVGFVLALPMETYLYQAVQFYGWDFLTRPGVLIIAALIVVFGGKICRKIVKPWAAYYWLQWGPPMRARLMALAAPQRSPAKSASFPARRPVKRSR